ncbi:MAG: HAD family phosphatase [Spirobacillus cienkowskii]|jgi:Cof subfamily protein (haloacid dehalogenase superfamily)|uniref:HAD family phosphatase n=1 Tax=Spirobacillus cienkowskii TaxID=495820 RepID=A0A369KUJ6_9BACT|nr:MAG: HAD family phosphatase [Spirobacillus cienkowskii]
MKAVALDLDGTLLNSKNLVSDYSKRILNDISKIGIKVVLASARPVRSVLQIAKDIGGMEDQFIIASNGALIANFSGEILYKKSIPKNIIADTWETISHYTKSNPKEEVTVHIYSEFKWLIPFYTESAQTEIKTIGFSPDIVGKEAFNIESAEKIMIVANPDCIQNIIKFIKDSKIKLNAVLSKPDYLEINAENVTKYSGVFEYAKLKNISVDNIMAFGDGDNDELMLKNCGFGIAMSNASERAKMAAKHVTLSNDEDGVARFLENHFLKK